MWAVCVRTACRQPSACSGCMCSVMCWLAFGGLSVCRLSAAESLLANAEPLSWTMIRSSVFCLTHRSPNARWDTSKLVVLLIDAFPVAPIDPPLIHRHGC